MEKLENKFTQKVPVSSTAAKRVRVEVDSDALSDSSAEELVLFCKRTDSANKKEIFDAMGKTFPNRQKWIQGENPTAAEIFEKFPRFIDIPA